MLKNGHHNPSSLGMEGGGTLWGTALATWPGLDTHQVQGGVMGGGAEAETGGREDNARGERIQLKIAEKQELSAFRGVVPVYLWVTNEI